VPYLLMKYLVTAALVVAVSELAKRSDKLGALLASLPLVTVLTLVWLYVEQQPTDKIANHAWYTFWYVVPTLPMFLLFPRLLGQLGFAGALGVFVLGTMVIFALYAWLMAKAGINLL
jgi:hypothetical protein